MSYNPTLEQNAIIEEIVTGHSDVVVEAGPGSGKTTTIVEAMKKLPTTAKILYLCFNKRVADEAQTKVTSNVTVKTLNSLGYRILLQNSRNKYRLNVYKTQNILQSYLGGTWNKATRSIEWADNDNRKTFCQCVNVVVTVVSLLKANCIVKPTMKDCLDMVDTYNVNTSFASKVNEEYLYRDLIPTIFKLCVESKKEIDFDDQIYLPVINGWKFNESYDYIFIDEAQDISLAQFKLTELCN